MAFFPTLDEPATATEKCRGLTRAEISAWKRRAEDTHRWSFPHFPLLTLIEFSVGFSENKQRHLVDEFISRDSSGIG